MRTVGQALLAVFIAIAPSAASKGCGVRTSDSPSSIAAASDEQSDDLMFSNGGALAFLRNRSPGADRVNTLKFETDDCGLLASIANGRATLRKSAFTGDADDFDDFDEDDPVVIAQTQISRWISTHPEIAVVSNGIDKWCDDVSLVGEDISPEFVAGWRSPIHRGRNDTGSWRWPRKPAYLT